MIPYLHHIRKIRSTNNGNSVIGPSIKNHHLLGLNNNYSSLLSSSQVSLHRQYASDNNKHNEDYTKNKQMKRDKDRRQGHWLKALTNLFSFDGNNNQQQQQETHDSNNISNVVDQDKFIQTIKNQAIEKINKDKSKTIEEEIKLEETIITPTTKTNSTNEQEDVEIKITSEEGEDVTLVLDEQQKQQKDQQSTTSTTIKEPFTEIKDPEAFLEEKLKQAHDQLIKQKNIQSSFKPIEKEKIINELKQEEQQEKEGEGEEISIVELNLIEQQQKQSKFEQKRKTPGTEEDDDDGLITNGAFDLSIPIESLSFSQKSWRKKFRQILLDAYNPRYIENYLGEATKQYNQKYDDDKLLFSTKTKQLDIFYEPGTIKALFDQMNWEEIDVQSYICNAFISYFTLIKDNDYINRSIELFKSKGFAYTPMTFSTMLDYYSQQGDKETVSALIETIKSKYSLKMPDSLMVPLMKACLMADKFADANMFYTLILDSTYRYNTQVLDHLLQYHLAKSNSSTILRFFQRNLPYSHDYVKNSKYFGTFMTEAIKKGIASQDIISFLISRKLVNPKLDFFNLYFHLLRHSDPTMRRYGAQLYNTFSHKKPNMKGQEIYSNSLKALMLIGDADNVMDLFHHYANEKTLFFHYQAMLEFFYNKKKHQHLEKILDHMCENKFYKMAFIPLLYFELTGNKELVQIIEKRLLVRGQEPQCAELIPTVTNYMIYAYLSLDMYEMALTWLGKKSIDYKSSIPNSLYENFATYHKERNQKGLEQIWLSHLVEKKINVIQSTILREDRMEDKPAKEEHQQKEKNLLVTTLLSELEHKWAIINVYNPTTETLKSVVDKYNANKHQNPLFEENSKSKRFIPELVQTLQDQYLKKDIIPPGASLIKAFNLLAKHAPTRYLEMLEKASPRIRAIVFNPTQLSLTFDSNFGEALSFLVQGKDLSISSITFNTIAHHLLKRGQVELAICVIRRMMAEKMRIDVDSLLIDILVDIDKVNHPIVQELTNYFSYYNYIIPRIVTSELDRLIAQGSVDEAYEFFMKAPKYPETLKAALGIFSAKFPIPPITNLMHWSSLVQLSTNTNRLFYEYFYETLYNNNLTNIVNLYVDKMDDDSFYFMSQKEFLIVLKSCKNAHKAIKLLKKYPHAELLPQTIEEAKRYNAIVKDVEISYRLEYKTKIYTEPAPEPLYTFKQIEQPDVETILSNFTNINPTDVIIETGPTGCRIISK
ncbi:hypothetical protein CYY_007829 [Polysphondylium violaceum]|uniref:Pentatricopeptide repeat-containing protein n=1 Tax=Polysphondylium violaceum TaxID=133409 RepID=A0A8J4UXT1_9MYCE|nr:hypothetical protein CYY_007829 [Polysphondylium violaceum]